MTSTLDRTANWLLSRFEPRADSTVPSVLGWRCRLANVAGRVAPRYPSLGEADLLAEARHARRLDDFGDEFFREPLRALIRSVEEDVDLSPVGRRLFRGEVLLRLTNRLMIADDLRRHPEILAVPVPPPIIITGLPRTGTTFLQRLLARDPDTRSFQAWELHRPSPPPELATYESDPRREAMRGSLVRRRRFLYSEAGLERVMAAHATQTDTPEECWPLLQNSFSSPIYGLYYGGAGYRTWLKNADLRPAYREHRAQIQLLTCRVRRRRLLLKAPSHLGWLELVHETYPDARILWTHRDPTQAIPSIAVMSAQVRQLHCNRVDVTEIGSTMLSALRMYLDRAIERRRELPSSSILDISYARFIDDPMATVRTIYDFLGEELTPAAERSMTDWLAGARGRQGRGWRHTPEMVGLTRERIEGEFAGYARRFPEAVPGV